MIVTKVVSKIGTKSISTGTASIENTLRDRPPVSLSSTELASKNPTNIDPQSPINIDAGLKLKTRKPRSPPQKPKPDSLIHLAIGINPTASDAPAISAIPAARPSILSSRLTALVMPITKDRDKRVNQFVSGKRNCEPQPDYITEPIS